MAMGFPQASKIASGTISKILGASNLKPHKISSYIYQADPDFDSKSIIILHTYKKVELLKKLKSEGGEVDMVIVSYDEKPGIQAIGNKHPDLMPVEGKHPTISHDYEPKASSGFGGSQFWCRTSLPWRRFLRPKSAPHRSYTLSDTKDPSPALPSALTGL